MNLRVHGAPPRAWGRPRRHRVVITFVNRQMESMFGYDRGGLLGLPIETLVPESLRAVHSRHREGYHDAPVQRPLGEDLSLSAQRRDGTRFPVDIALSHSNTADGPLVIAAVRDMTDLYKSRGLLLVGVSLLAPDVTGEVIAALLPEAALGIPAVVQGHRPFRALPAIEVG